MAKTQKTILLSFYPEEGTVEHEFELKGGEPVIDGGRISWDEVRENWIMFNFKINAPEWAQPYVDELKAISAAYDWDAHWRCRLERVTSRWIVRVAR